MVTLFKTSVRALVRPSCMCVCEVTMENIPPAQEVTHLNFLQSNQHFEGISRLAEAPHVCVRPTGSLSLLSGGGHQVLLFSLSRADEKRNVRNFLCSRTVWVHFFSNV